MSMKSRILILGAKGRLGERSRERGRRITMSEALARPELDVADLAALERLLKSKPCEVLVNCTGLTKCGPLRNSARRGRDRQRPRARRDGRWLPRSAPASSILAPTTFLDRCENNAAISEEDLALPLGHYGRTKLAGERAAPGAVAPASRVAGRVGFWTETNQALSHLIHRTRPGERPGGSYCQQDLVHDFYRGRRHVARAISVRPIFPAACITPAMPAAAHAARLRPTRSGLSRRRRDFHLRRGWLSPSRFRP